MSCFYDFENWEESNIKTNNKSAFYFLLNYKNKNKNEYIDIVASSKLLVFINMVYKIFILSLM